MGVWNWLATKVGRRSTTPQNLTFSIGDPAVAGLFAMGAPNFANVEVNEVSVLGVSAVYRAVSLISGTLAGLPLKTYRDIGDGTRQQMTSFLDDPGKLVGLTPFAWKQTVLVHLLLHGNAFLKHIRGPLGNLIGLQPIHPMLVSIVLPTPGAEVQPVGGKWFWVTTFGGEVLKLDANDMTHVMGLSLDGIQGVSVIAVARNSFGTAIAGDRAAARMFANGALVSGMVTPDDDALEPEEAAKIQQELAGAVGGWENNASVPVINRRLKFTQWSLSAQDAQFLESRQFSTREVARLFGIPPHLLGETSAASNWGTGIEQLDLGLGRHTLAPWATAFEQALSALLPGPRCVEFDFAKLVRPGPVDEVNLVIAQVNAGLMTKDEGRVALGRQPLGEAGDTPAEQAQDAPTESQDSPAEQAQEAMA